MGAATGLLLVALLGGSLRALARAAADGPAVATLNNGLAFPKVSFGLRNTTTHTPSSTQSWRCRLESGTPSCWKETKGFGQALGENCAARRSVRAVRQTRQVAAVTACFRQTRAACNTNLADLGAGGGLKGYLDMIMLDYPAGDCTL